MPVLENTRSPQFGRYTAQRRVCRVTTVPTFILRAFRLFLEYPLGHLRGVS